VVAGTSLGAGMDRAPIVRTMVAKRIWFRCMPMGLMSQTGNSALFGKG
jgi:hypothetical protein